MFDRVTSAIIANAPKLSGVKQSRLSAELANAYVQVSVARHLLAAEKPLEEATIERLLGIAQAQEAIALGLEDGEVRRAAAFVAGRAYQAIASIGDVQRDALTPSSIPASVSAMLLFLVADSTPDAEEMARLLPSEEQPVEHAVLLALRALGSSRPLDAALVEMPARTLPTGENPQAIAAQVGYYEIADALRAFCSRLVSTRDAAWSPGRFDQIRDQMAAVIRVLPLGDTLIDDTVSGPWHLASLLSMAEAILVRSALVNVPAPPNVANGPWSDIVERIAQRRPILWRNHRDAVKAGLLDPGTSAVITFPTGSGKSTITELKIAATVLAGKRVIILVPTLSLLTQQANAVRSTLPSTKVFAQNDVVADSHQGLALDADVLVFTPESCLATIGSNPTQFGDVGLIIFDEAHLLHSPEVAGSRRAVDANLCTLLLADSYESADILLTSAMIGNADLLKEWLIDLTGRPALALNDAWKPTRQARGAVVYRADDIQRIEALIAQSLANSTSASPPTRLRAEATATPLVFFGLQSTWESLKASDYKWMEVVDHAVPLGVTGTRPGWHLSGNVNTLGAEIASAGANSGRKVLIFVQQVGWAASTAKKVNPRSERRVRLRPDESALLKRAISLLGSTDALYGRFEDGQVIGDSLPHHGLLLPEERRLHEKLYSREDGVPVLVATSTLAQGMNLPSEIVVIAGDRRFDSEAGRNERLQAQELLNAAGRAGRAGMNSNGLVIVVPNYPATYDGSSAMSRPWFSLRETFSQADQCVEVADPITALILADPSEFHDDLDYLGRRIAASEGSSDAGTLYFRSLGAFKSRRDQDGLDLAARFASLVAVHRIDGDPWLKEVVAATGLDPADVEHIAAALAPGATLHSIPECVRWMMTTLRARPSLLESVLRRGSRAVFRGAPDDLSSEWSQLSDSRLIESMEPVLNLWMQGATLVEIEEMAARERLVRRPTVKCDFARRFALRVVPDLAFLFSLPHLIARKRDPDVVASESLQILGRAVELGVDSVEKVLNLDESPRLTRVDLRSAPPMNGPIA